MNSTITVIRCIGADFASRLYYPTAIISAIICVLLVTGVLLLETLSAWWLLLLIPVIILICVAFGVLMITWLVIRAVRPSQTKAQRSAVKAFVDKLQRVADAIQTPKIVLLFRIVRDIAAPRENGFIGSMADDTSSLKRDFNELKKIF